MIAESFYDMISMVQKLKNLNLVRHPTLAEETPLRKCLLGQYPLGPSLKDLHSINPSVRNHLAGHPNINVHQISMY